MHAITTIKPSAGATIKQFPQPDSLRAIERAMQQLVDSGRAHIVTLLVTEDDGRLTEITVGGTEQ